MDFSTDQMRLTQRAQVPHGSALSTSSAHRSLVPTVPWVTVCHTGDPYLLARFAQLVSVPPLLQEYGSIRGVSHLL